MDKIHAEDDSLERSRTSENEKDTIERHEEPAESSSGSIDEKKEAIARVIESPVPEEQLDTGAAGQPGNWRSKVGISFPRMDKWNPSFKPPSLGHTGSVIWKLAKFYGPGAIISVAYIDPDNYQTAIAAGAEFQYKLLFMILVANIMAIYLQQLCAKLGAVTGMTLAEMHRVYLPKWLNLFLWIMAEATIICTDVGQVIGTAIAINLLQPKIPLLGGCALSILDAFSILLIYNPRARLYLIRPFELFIAIIVTTVFCLFIVELTKISAPVGQVFKGFLPSRDVFVGQGLFQSSAIVGGNLMPHSLYVGSSLVHARLREFDIKEDLYPESDGDSMTSVLWRPSYRGIKSTLKYTIAELWITIFVIAVFVNSAVLIVAAARLPESAQDADLFGMYALFRSNISPAAATIFAIGLLFSGTSAGIVATMAGQLVMEGALQIRINPFVRRLVTRLIAIVPAMIVAAAVGRQGLGQALNACNVVLSIGLIFLVAPIVWYTSNKRYMTVIVSDSPQVRPNRRVSNEQQRRDAETPEDECRINMANSWWDMSWAVIVWLLIVILNIAAIVLLGLGTGKD